jgi:hypothetical protein
VNRQLAELLPDTFIDIFEIDEEILNISKEFFNFQESSKVKVHIGDAFELIKNVEGNTIVAQGGTYNFRFKILNVEMGNENTEVFYDVLVDGDGEVEINFGTDYEPEIIDRLYDAAHNPDIGWQVIDEIKDLLRETVREKVVDYPCHLSDLKFGTRKDF